MLMGGQGKAIVWEVILVYLEAFGSSPVLLTLLALPYLVIKGCVDRLCQTAGTGQPVTSCIWSIM